MGFLDKLFGRSKETAGDVADKAAPVVDKAEDAAGDAVDEAKDTVSDLTHRGDEPAEATDAAEPGPDKSGSTPPAA